MKTSRYFTEQGRDRKQIVEKLNKKYGGNFRILKTTEINAPGLYRLLGNKWVESSGIVLNKDEARQVREIEDTRNRDKILASLGVDVPPNKSEKVAQEKAFNASDLMNMLKDIKEQILLGTSVPPAAEPFQVLAEIRAILKENEFEESFTDGILATLKNQFTAVELENRIDMHNATVRAIAATLHFPGPTWQLPPRKLVLIGPTGVGKTTTIAKLAALYGLLGKNQLTVRLITVDYYRLAALEQLKAYGDVMEIPVIAVNNHEQLKLEINKASDADLILVDTIGNSPKEKKHIEEMRSLISACGDDAEIHLAVSATTKSTDLREILHQFKEFNYRSVIITKLDETMRPGSIISVIGSLDKTVSYLTTGQGVPHDIAIATPQRLFGMIKGLEYDSEVLEFIPENEDSTGVNI